MQSLSPDKMPKKHTQYTEKWMNPEARATPSHCENHCDNTVYRNAFTSLKIAQQASY